MEESTLLKRLLILKCISSPQSKDVGKIDFCMERNARVDTPKSAITFEGDLNMNFLSVLVQLQFPEHLSLLFKVPSDFFFNLILAS